MPIEASKPARNGDYPPTCLACKHFRITAAEPAWSDWTPGSAFEMYCWKDVWTFDSYRTSDNDFREMLQTARTCAHFDEKY